MAARIAVVGTGTGVGKTHVSVALLTALARRGERASGLKPIETGVSSGETDAGLLSVASSVAPFPSLYTFVDPVSPHLAARRTGTSISVDAVADWVGQHRADWLLIETAGGLLSPLGPGLTNLDLVRAVSPQLIYLVAVDRLGVLHDVTACMVALRSLLPDHPPVICLLQAPATPDSSLGTNAEELQRLGIAPRLTSFPRAESGDLSMIAAANEALDLVLSHA